MSLRMMREERVDRCPVMEISAIRMLALELGGMLDDS